MNKLYENILTFDKLFPNATDRNLSKYITPLLDTFKKYNINTKERIAAFCAQIEIESGSLKYVEEIASGSAYEYRKDLGNLDKEALSIAHSLGKTTGRFYKGRGLIQITGFYNYKECGKALELDLIHEPELLCKPVPATYSAGWYFDTHNCNVLADVFDIKGITRKINGGYTHLDRRVAAFKRNLQILYAN